MSFVRYKYLEENGIISPIACSFARAIEKYDFPKPIALGENTIAWPLDEVENWLKIPPPAHAEMRREKAARRDCGGRVSDASNNRNPAWWGRVRGYLLLAWRHRTIPG